MPGLADSMPVPDLLVFRSANFGRLLHAFFSTAANTRYFVQPGDREPTTPAEQDSWSLTDGPFLTEYSV